MKPSWGNVEINESMKKARSLLNKTKLLNTVIAWDKYKNQNRAEVFDKEAQE